MPCMSPLLLEIEKMIDSLDDSDRQRLMQYLTPRLTIASEQQPAATWQRFREIGQRLARLSDTGGSITNAVSEMRR